MSKIKLSASQIREMDERYYDKMGQKSALEIAMQYHANRISEIKKDEAKWWDEVIAQHDLDPLKKWETDRIEGAVCIVAVEKKED